MGADRAVLVIRRHGVERPRPAGAVAATFQKVQPEGTDPSNFRTPAGAASQKVIATGARSRFR